MFFVSVMYEPPAPRGGMCSDRLPPSAGCRPSTLMSAGVVHSAGSGLPPSGTSSKLSQSVAMQAVPPSRTVPPADPSDDPDCPPAPPLLPDDGLPPVPVIPPPPPPLVEDPPDPGDGAPGAVSFCAASRS